MRPAAYRPPAFAQRAAFPPPAAPDMVIDNGADDADLQSFAAQILDKALAR